MDVWGKIIKNIFSIQIKIVEIAKKNDKLAIFFFGSKKLKNVSNGGGRKKSINFALFIVISIITDTGRKK